MTEIPIEVITEPATTIASFYIRKISRLELEKHELEKLYDPHAQRSFYIRKIKELEKTNEVLRRALNHKREQVEFLR
jgi:hypothetical protein